MKHYFIFLVFTALLFGTKVPAFAAISLAEAAIQPPADDHPKTIATMKLKEFQRLAGRKLSFKEKLGFLVLRHKMRHGKIDENGLGEISFILGFAGVGLLVAGLFAPALILGSFVTAIVAIVTGSMAKKEGGDNRKANAGKLMGWITLGTILLLLGVALIAFAAWI